MSKHLHESVDKVAMLKLETSVISTVRVVKISQTLL